MGNIHLTGTYPRDPRAEGRRDGASARANCDSEGRTREPYNNPYPALTRSHKLYEDGWDDGYLNDT